MRGIACYCHCDNQIVNTAWVISLPLGEQIICVGNSKFSHHVKARVVYSYFSYFLKQPHRMKIVTVFLNSTIMGNNLILLFKHFTFRWNGKYCAIHLQSINNGRLVCSGDNRGKIRITWCSNENIVKIIDEINQSFHIRHDLLMWTKIMKQLWPSSFYVTLLYLLFFLWLTNLNIYLKCPIIYWTFS